MIKFFFGEGVYISYYLDLKFFFIKFHPHQGLVSPDNVKKKTNIRSTISVALSFKKKLNLLVVNLDFRTVINFIDKNCTRLFTDIVARRMCFCVCVYSTSGSTSHVWTEPVRAEISATCCQLTRIFQDMNC